MKLHPQTELPGECSCQDCKNACAHRPGFFRREQIEPLANALNLTVPELVQKHLQVDFFSGDDVEDVCMLVPRLKGERGGTQIDNDPRGVCHWFVDGKCRIHQLGKPAECAELVHGPDGQQVKVDRVAIARTWVGQEEFIEQVTGDFFFPHEPQSMFSSLFMRFEPYYPNPNKPDPYAETESIEGKVNRND